MPKISKIVDIPKASSISLHPGLRTYVEDVVTRFGDILPERKEPIEELARFVASKRSAGEPAKITYICTHNARRSHIAQLWAAAAAAYYGLEGVETYSGGTEVTAFNPRAVAALERAGFEIDVAHPNEDNPRYSATFASDAANIEAFSKRYDDDPNPEEDFAAVMTCSQAGKGCPLVHGAVLRIALPFDDPKAADGTEREAVVYDARTRQIATEMFYLFSRVRP